LRYLSRSQVSVQGTLWNYEGCIKRCLPLEISAVPFSLHTAKLRRLHLKRSISGFELVHSNTVRYITLVMSSVPGKEVSSDLAQVDTFDHWVQACHCSRKFLPTAAPKSLVDESLTVDQNSPSNLNIQPWRCTSVSGAGCDQRRGALLLLLSSACSTIWAINIRSV